MGINTRQRILLMIGLPVVLIYLGIVWFTLDRLGDQAEAGVEREYAVRAHRYASLFDFGSPNYAVPDVMSRDSQRTQAL